MSRLLRLLTKFYRQEAQGSVDDALLWDVAAELADFLELRGPDSNAAKDIAPLGDDHRFRAFLDQLRTNPTVLLVDRAVHSIHSDLVEDVDEQAVLLEADSIRDYFLNREKLLAELLSPCETGA